MWLITADKMLFRSKHCAAILESVFCCAAAFGSARRRRRHMTQLGPRPFLKRWQPAPAAAIWAWLHSFLPALCLAYIVRSNWVDGAGNASPRTGATGSEKWTSQTWSPSPRINPRLHYRVSSSVHSFTKSDWARGRGEGGVFVPTFSSPCIVHAISMGAKIGQMQSRVWVR